MNVGEAARRAGLPIKTLHYYEEIGLVRPGRRPNGYRSYSDQDVHKLRFLQRARGLGFSIGECRTLLALYDDENRASADVRAVAMAHLEKVRRKIEELKSIEAVIDDLVRNCQGDHRPDCPILKDLAVDMH